MTLSLCSLPLTGLDRLLGTCFPNSNATELGLPSVGGVKGWDGVGWHGGAVPHQVNNAARRN